MKVLVSAYACQPEKGSEPGIGWNWVRQIGCIHQVWAITRSKNRASIETALAEKPLPNAHFVYFDLPCWARFWRKDNRGIRLHYYLWQLAAYFQARKLHREITFDLIHHVTYGSYWRPVFLSLLPVPFVWGPIGGGESAPRAFWSSYGLRGKAYEVLRDLARALGARDPFVRLAARRAAVALAATEETKTQLKALGCRKVSVCSNAALPTEELQGLSNIPFRQGNPFRLLSVGRLLHWKGFELGLKAFAQFHRQFPESEYWIIGEGPERKRLEKLAREMEVTRSVSFWGALPRSEVLGKLAECDVLVHPSLHDSGGWVCLEAMAAGRPVICLDLGGPGLQVTEQTGIKVPAISPLQAIADLAAAMGQLAGDPDRRLRLGRCARLRVAEHFAWDKKGEQMNQIYHSIQSIRTTQARSE